MKISEHQIVEMLHQNDRKVISIIYDKYAPALYGVVLRIVRSEEIAKDVMQDSFLKIWKNGQQYNSSKGTLFTWLLNIARNTAIDKIRSANFRRSDKIQPVDDFVSNKEATIGTIKPEHIGVKELVNNLDSKYKEVIDLIYFNGFTQQEVSDHLNIPLGTVKSRIRIALRELKSIFDTQTIFIITFISNMLTII